MSGPPNKGMKLTKLSAAPEHGRPAWLALRCRLMPAPPRQHAGTASQLIPGVRRTSKARVSAMGGPEQEERNRTYHGRLARYLTTRAGADREDEPMSQGNGKHGDAMWLSTGWDGHELTREAPVR